MMKRIIKELLIFTIISILFVLPINGFAITNTTTSTNISYSDNLKVGSLNFDDISFKNFNVNKYTAIGLSGLVTNSSKDDINYTVTIYLYDSNNDLIAEWDSTATAKSGSNSFSSMEDSDILNEYTTDDIYYYSFKIDTDEIENTISNYGNYTPSQMSEYNHKDYVIDKYDIDMVVNKNNTFDITETIVAYFNYNSHGIIRSIPIVNELTRLDGTSSKNRAQITNIFVNKDYKKYKEDNYLKLKIGSSTDLVSGKQEYVIKYTYNIGKDPLKDIDELYYNLIGNEWDSVIGNITFKITMPDNFDRSKLGFSSGPLGYTSNSNIKYDISGNVITGQYEGILDEQEALTVRCELPEGYFVGAGYNISPLTYILYLLPLVFLIISIIKWYKYGRDDDVVETVEFYPPNGLNSLDVGFLYKGMADTKDVTSLLIYLANQGYIKITETETKLVFSRTKGFKITRLKAYDGYNRNEELFLNGLFDISKVSWNIFNTNDDHLVDRNVVTNDQLYDNFYRTKNKILKNVNSDANKARVFDQKASKQAKSIIIMVILSYIMISIPSILEFGDLELLIATLFITFMGFGFMLSILFDWKITRDAYSLMSPKLTGIIVGVIFGAVPLAFNLIPTLVYNKTYLIGYILGISSIIGMLIVLKILPKRTEYGREMLGKLKGFKNFLETAEKETLEDMVMKDPEYFYNILPYAYVLGVSSKWISKFESINLRAPNWLDSTSPFDIHTFNTFMDSTMSTALNSMSSSPGSSDGGSSSGGGSSGGGSGGGGGSSW